MRRLVGALVVGMTGAILAGSAVSPSAQTPNAAASTEWPTYGHDPGGMRFSPVALVRRFVFE